MQSMPVPMCLQLHAPHVDVCGTPPHDMSRILAWQSKRQKQYCESTATYGGFSTYCKRHSDEINRKKRERRAANKAADAADAAAAANEAAAAMAGMRLCDTV